MFVAMYQHFNNRKRFIQRIIAYIFMILAVIAGVTGATAWVLGYRFNLEQKEVDRITLLQFSSFPTGAKVFVDDKQLNFSTPGRYDEAAPGAHKIKYSLDGYRDWEKPVSLKAAEVRWLNYARLIPEKITASDAANFAGFHQALTSPNGDYILLAQSAASRILKLIDISDPKNIKTSDLKIPDSILEGTGKEKFEIIEWDRSSNYILLSRNIGKKSEILKIDRREMSISQNLSKLFGYNITNPHFLGNDNNIVYGISGSTLRKFDIRGKTTSAPLVNGIENYDLYGDGKIAYVTSEKNHQKVGILSGDRDTTIFEYNDVKPTLASFTHYYHSDYLVVARDQKLNIVSKPLNDNNDGIISIETPGGVDYLSHNGSGRILLAGRKDKVFSFDLETSENFQFITKGFSSQPFWVDDYHLGYAAAGLLNIAEFDGANLQKLLPSLDFGVFSGNNEHLFTFVKKDKKIVLQNSAMILLK
jgi:hypothetical protein